MSALPASATELDGEALAAEQLLAQTVSLLGGEVREGQVAMVAEVAAAIAQTQPLLVQAGTGTGKTLGYLAPAVVHAVENVGTVVVATATLTLQRQLVNRDLPLIALAAKQCLARTPSFALLKGRNNYVCKYKVAGGYAFDDDEFNLFAAGAEGKDTPQTRKLNSKSRSGAREAEPFSAAVKRVLAWANETETGDRDDLVPGVSDRVWRQVSLSALECLGNKCPMVSECFTETAREAARNADIVVTNHAMLAVAASGSPGVLPEHEVLIVDEAHDLSGAVTSGATVELSQPALNRVARLGRSNGVPSTSLDQAAVAFGLALANAPEGRFTTELPADLAEAIVVVRDETRKLVTALKPEGATEVDGPLKIAQSAALVTFEIADRLANACNEGSEGEVIWVTRNDDGHSRLYIAPRDVGHLIDDLTTDITGVFTSATLMIGGKFDAVARSLGLPLGGYRAVDVGSPFDYPSQGILYIASHLETPGRASSIESQLDEIEALIRAAGGRTLGLFSSRRAATLAAEAMRERLDTAVLLQGEDQLPTQLAEFAADASASLFGSFSLWQGVDVPGSACQLVIIDRLGFPRPDDPVMSARAEAVAQAGGNGFMAVTATHTALRLAQAAGRLIRTSADKGVVAVLDPRLVKARYGEFLIRSLPDFWRTTDQATVLAALARLDVAASQP